MTYHTINLVGPAFVRATLRVSSLFTSVYDTVLHSHGEQNCTDSASPREDTVRKVPYVWADTMPIPLEVRQHGAS